ncbi:hypothetical protein CYMTET_22814 [Cymbomonas tetramitiformis]|uniref:Uncharacterized protein n=1 Tax=Cymbomonas tetramitiformis TaxID=36881 RepID=A0AAE0G001_9CHLO|nr:hypothetical protein CYMTET_22814 [Cymbomonas tetramitiformis]
MKELNTLLGTDAKRNISRAYQFKIMESQAMDNGVVEVVHEPYGATKDNVMALVKDINSTNDINRRKDVVDLS